jgi:hypothetical protein
MVMRVTAPDSKPRKTRCCRLVGTIDSRIRPSGLTVTRLLPRRGAFRDACRNSDAAYPLKGQSAPRMSRRCERDRM